MIISDLIILGRACPEPLKDGRVTICLAGWSEQHGFIRLYPTRYDMKWRRWDIVRVEVEENERDNRAESWKIAGSRNDWDNLANKVEVIGHIKKPAQRHNLVAQLVDGCVNVINEQKRSLGIVQPTEISEYYWANNPRHGSYFQLGLPLFTDFDKVKVKRDFPWEPRVTYRCSNCQIQTQHDQQVLEWGFYEWLRKNPEAKEQVWENAGFMNPNSELYFLVGNQFAHRTSFMIISVLRVPKGPTTSSLFPVKKYDEIRMKRLLDSMDR
ncbi:MAG: hypothetical protein Kow0077_12960 [Anaerolineae bacterium]